MDIQRNQMTKEVEDWINEVISKPNKIFGNLPPCPYARKAWKDKKVKVTYDRIVSEQDYEKVKSGELDLIMIIQQGANVDELYEFKHYLENTWLSPTDKIAVQNRHKLNEARKFLETTDYYKNFDEEYKNDILSN